MRGLSKCYSYISRWPSWGTWNIINRGRERDEVYLANRRTEWDEEKRLKAPLKLSESEAFTEGWNKNGSQNIPASAAFPRAAERSWESGEAGLAQLAGLAAKTVRKLRGTLFSLALWWYIWYDAVAHRNGPLNWQKIICVELWLIDQIMNKFHYHPLKDVLCL